MSSWLGFDREPGSDRPLASQFRFDTGSVALNLAATLGYRDADLPVERLTTVARTRDWLAASGLPVVVTTAAQVGELRELRESAYPVLRAMADGVTPPRAAVHRLAGWTRRPCAGPELYLDGGRLAWRVPTPTFAALCARLARELAELAVSGSADLRVCAADGCGLVYRDTSPGRRRRWCSMQRCGNAAKAARHRARNRPSAAVDARTTT